METNIANDHIFVLLPSAVYILDRIVAIVFALLRAPKVSHSGFTLSEQPEAIG